MLGLRRVHLAGGNWSAVLITLKQHVRTAACLVWLVLLPFHSGAQTAVMSSSVDGALDQSYNAMYNLDFAKAFQQAEIAKAANKDDPMPWVAQACAVLFREFERLHILRSELFSSDENFDGRSSQAWDPKTRPEFENALQNGERLAGAALGRNSGDTRALFALTLLNGLRADDAALISKKNMAALSYTKSANSYAERLLARAPDYYDAYLATGMGKYIIGGKAAPVRWILRLGGVKGDQEEGVREMKLAAERGHYLAPFARILLAFDDLRHKNNAAARTKLAALHDQFPRNTLFIQELAKLDHGPRGAGQ
jgi:hypothetical protein